MSKSVMALSLSHFLRNFFITFESDSKMAVGMARSATLEPIGFLTMINFTLTPLPLTISGPKNSLSLLAQVIIVPFLSSYSLRFLPRNLFSPMQSISSESSMYQPSVSRISNHLLATSPQASQHSCRVLPSKNLEKTSSQKILTSLSSPLLFSSKPLTSVILPAWLKTAYLFLSILFSSLEAGIIIAL